MRITSRCFMCILVLTMMLLTLTIPVHASETNNDVSLYSTTDTKFFNLAPTSTYSQVYGLLKEDTTPVFVRVDTTKVENIVRIRVMGHSNTHVQGCPTAEGCANCKNVTYYGNGIAPYVRCQKGINYSISTVAKEWGYPRVSLGFKSTNLELDDEVSGWWSADTSRTHNTPIAP